MDAAAPQVHVGFHLTKVWQKLGVRPFVIAPCGPLIVVLRGATQDDLAIERTGPPDGFATRHEHGLRLMGSGHAGKCPVVVPYGGSSCMARAFPWNCDVAGIPSRTTPDCFAVSEKRCRGGNALQIFVRGRIDEGDTEFIGDKPVRLLQMMRTVTQNDRE